MAEHGLPSRRPTLLGQGSVPTSRDHLTPQRPKMLRGATALLPILLALAAPPARAQTDALPPDKSGYTLFNPTPSAAMRDFNADRPTRSNGPITVDAGHLQIESDLAAYTHSTAAGTTTRLIQAFDPVLKLGITNRIDLELQFTGYNWLSATPRDNQANLASARGAGDLVVRTKVNLFGNDGGGPALALIPYIKVPTAAATIGNGHTEGGLIAPLALPLPWNLVLTLVPELDILKNQFDAGHHLNATGVIDLGYSPIKAVTLYAELYAARGADKRIPPVYTVDTAIAWMLTNTLQLDLGTNIGLNRNAPNLQLYTGIAERF